MSFLSDFAGNFLQLAGQEGMRRSEEDRQLRLREALERRRRKEDYEFQQAVNPTQAQPYGPVTQRGPGNFVQPTREYQRARFDDEGNILSEATWKPGADMPAQDPNALTPWQRYQADRNMTTDEAYERRTQALSRGGGLTADQEIDNKRADEQLDLSREAAERAKREEDRQTRQDALEEARNRIEPFLDQIDELETTQDASGGSELSRFMAQQGAPREAQNSPAAAKAWLRKKAQDEVFSEYGIGGTRQKQGDSQGEGTAIAAPPAAIAALKDDPSRAAQFDAKYGRGAAAKVLGR